MADEITIRVCDVHADIHRRLQDVVGEQYTGAIREEVEDAIHDRYREIERQQEQRATRAAGSAPQGAVTRDENGLPSDANPDEVPDAVAAQLADDDDAGDDLPGQRSGNGSRTAEQSDDTGNEE